MKWFCTRDIEKIVFQKIETSFDRDYEVQFKFNCFCH